MGTAELLPAPLLPQQTERLELSVIFDSIILAAQQKEAWEAHYNNLLEALTIHPGMGHLAVGDCFKTQGWSFRWSHGATAYEWPSNISELEAQLMEAQEDAVRDKTAIKKPSTPLWIVTWPKPIKPLQVAA
jgi:hypothetical protein